MVKHAFLVLKREVERRRRLGETGGYDSREDSGSTAEDRRIVTGREVRRVTPFRVGVDFRSWTPPFPTGAGFLPIDTKRVTRTVGPFTSRV